MCLKGICVWIGLAAAVLQGAPIDCGTVANPAVCSLQVGGEVEYVFSNFQITNSVGITGLDIGVQLSTGGGLTGIVTFTKVNPDTGAVFFANPSQTRGFTVRYDLAVNPLLPGTAALETPSIVAYGLTSVLGSGFSGAQLILSDGNQGTSCQAILNSGGVTPGTCATFPPGVTNALTAGLIASLTGPPGTNNVSFNSLSNSFDASFTPQEISIDPPTGGEVPEPSTWGLMGLGLGALAWRGRRSSRS